MFGNFRRFLDEDLDLLVHRTDDPTQIRAFRGCFGMF